MTKKEYKELKKLFDSDFQLGPWNIGKLIELVRKLLKENEPN